MKKLFSLACLLATSAVTFAASSITATPSSFNINSTSGSFNVTLTLNTTVTNISSFDLFLQSASTGINNGNFTITNTVSSVPNAAPAASGQNPDSIMTRMGSGTTARNGVDQGFSYATDQPVSSSFTLETLTISYNFASLPAPGTNYTFSTTPSGAGGAPGTYFYSDNLGTFNTIDTPATFTVSVVPEPSTWICLAFGGSILGLVMVRRSRAV